MKNKLLKFAVIILVLTFIPVFSTAAGAYDGFAIENDHNVQISADEIYDENKVPIAKSGGNDKYETVIEQEVTGNMITLYGYVACDMKISAFGYAYAFDGNAVMNGEKYVASDHDLLQTIFSGLIGTTGEVTRFMIDVPVYDGENELYALVQLEDGTIYTIWRILYTGNNGNTPEYPKEQDVSVSVTVDGKSMKNKKYSVPAYIMYDYFYIDMENVTAEIDKKYGGEYAVREILINGSDADYADTENNIPRGELVVLDGYNDGDVISVTYEKVASATVDPNYSGGKKITVKAVHGALVSLDENIVRKDMVVIDFNTKPDGSGESCIVDGYLTFPSDTSVDLNNFTIYAIWKTLSVPGDVNGDGAANNKDIVALFKLVSGEDVLHDEFAVDVNNDGEENNKDVVALFKYVSGGDIKAYYYGYTLKQSVADFSFELPKGFIEAVADDENLMLIGICGDMIVAQVSSWPSSVSLAQVSDAEFRQGLESGEGVSVSSVTRKKINGVYAVRVKFTMSGDVTVPGEAVFIAKGSSLLTVTYFDGSGLYTSELDKTVLSIK